MSPTVLQTDLYQLTMAAAYFLKGYNPSAVFELFVRSLPPNRGYLIFAGLEEAIEFAVNFGFSGEDIQYLRTLPQFERIPGEFFDYLSELRFSGDVWAVPEGTPVFAGEPLVRVEAPLIEAQLLETFFLSAVNFATSVATKAARIVDVAGGRMLLEFGTRRAHGAEAAVIAARSAYLAGFDGTSNVEAGRRFGIPVAGTMAHSFVLAFGDEGEAFRSYYEVFGEDSIVLIDTYDTILGARRAAESVPHLKGVRLDSGDLAGLAISVREYLDSVGKRDTKIVLSGDLNEYKIWELVREGIPADAFGVGTELSTVKDAPALSGVYKLVSIWRDGDWRGVVKRSSGKGTYPGAKQVYRIFSDRGVADRDVVALVEEPPVDGGRPLLKKYISGGRLVRELPALEEIRTYCKEELEKVSRDVRRIEDPARYIVDYSDKVLKWKELIVKSG